MDKKPVKPVLSIRHLIASSLENEKKKEPLLRSGPFRWQGLRRRKTADRKEKIFRKSIDFESQKSEESDEFFSDALSNTEVDACSVSMVSDVNTNDEDNDDDDDEEETSRRNFIMDRFLPAATAMASESQARHQETYRPIPQQPMRRVPLPRQSRPYLMRKDSIGRSDDDEEDERMKSLKMACGGLFCIRLKKNVFGVNPLSLISPKRKPNLAQSYVYDNDGEETSSGTDEERAVIMATRQRALEGKYRQQQLLSCSNSREFPTSAEIGQALLNRISYTTDPTLSHPQSYSPLRKPTPSPSASRAISPYRNEAPLSPFSQERKGFLGFPTDRRAQPSKALNIKDNIQNSNDNEQEDCYYSGHSSPHHSSSDSSAAPNTSLEIPGSNKYKNELISGSGSSPVSVLPPPLPKSPTESWLWRAIPQPNNPSSRQATIKPIKPNLEEFNTYFDDAKWEI